MDVVYAPPRFDWWYLPLCLALGFCLCLLGAAWWLALLAGLAGWSLNSRFYSGQELAPPGSRQIRNFRGVGPWRFGRWQPLPEVVGVTLKYYSAIHQNTSKYNWEGGQRHRSEELVLLLSVRNSATGFILHKADISRLAEMHQLAAEVSRFMAVPLAVYLPPPLQ